MKKILLLLAIPILMMTGCQSFKNDNPPASHWNNSNWTRGGGAIGMP